MKITGQCHCGSIKYEATLSPDRVGICHCQDCQSLSASAFRTVAIVPAESFAITQGTPKHYIKTGSSGNRRIQAFCAECGSGLYATDADSAPVAYNLRAGTIDQRDELQPHFECWRQSALDWVPDLASTRKFDRNPEF